MNNEPYNIELKEGAKPYHSRPFPIPKIHERTLKVELDRLINLGVLKRINASKWATPTFIISKKDATVRFISDFCELNKCIKHKHFPIFEDSRLATETRRVSACNVPQS